MAHEIDLRDGTSRRDEPRPQDGDGEARGRGADTPTEVPPRGWKDVLVRTAVEARRDHATLLAAGVAFFGMLAMVPALVALVSLYGLISDPTDVARHVGDVLGAAPSEVRDLVENQLAAVSERSSTSAGVGAVAGVVVALWSASSGMSHLIEGLNAAYDEDEGRGFLRVRALALVLTVLGIVFVVAAFAVVTVVPSLVEGSALDDAAQTAIKLARWPALAVAFAVALAVLYRYGPSRDEAEWQWVSPGAILATALWLLGSGVFSLYVSRFGSYDETYGSLGGVVIAMLWLLLTALVTILGAELNAETERQTHHDTTEGRHRPLGARDAHAADTVGPTAEQALAEHKQDRAAANR